MPYNTMRIKHPTALLRFNAQPKFYGYGFLCILFMGLFSIANAGHTAELIRQLRQDPDYKVRLSAALRLGRQGERQAIPAFIEALQDNVASVRTVSAAALGYLIDKNTTALLRRSALLALERTFKRDLEKSVRDTAFRSIQTLRRLDKDDIKPIGVNSIFVYVDKIQDLSKQLSLSTLKHIKELIKNELENHTPTIISNWPYGERPDAKALKQVQVNKAFMIHGTLQIDLQPHGRRIDVQCTFKLILANYPNNAARVFFKQGAILDTINKPEHIDRAKVKVCQDVVKRLVRTELKPDVITREP